MAVWLKETGFWNSFLIPMLWRRHCRAKTIPRRRWHPHERFYRWRQELVNATTWCSCCQWDGDPDILLKVHMTWAAFWHGREGTHNLHQNIMSHVEFLGVARIKLTYWFWAHPENQLLISTSHLMWGGELNNKSCRTDKNPQGDADMRRSR